MFIIRKLILGIPYFLQEKPIKSSYKSSLSWEGLTDNATRYETEEAALLTIKANGLDAMIMGIKK